MSEDPVVIREIKADDDPEILDLLSSGLAWIPDDRHDSFFEWKHRTNPFGPSLGWVALINGELAGLRLLLRWQLVDATGRRMHAVRAVDTVTHPKFQGRGVFSRLARHALEHLAQDGTDFVFNTPNEKSRPGYLKLGWREVGEVPAALRLRPTRLHRLAGARRAADKWSVPTDAGLPAADVLADRAEIDALVETRPRPNGARTRVDASYLQWRYGFDALCYRAELVGATVGEGMVIYRLRARGRALEAAIVELLLPRDGRSVRPTLARIAATTGADHLLAAGPLATPRRGFIRARGQGPMLVWRGVADANPPSTWDLGLGDIELF